MAQLHERIAVIGLSGQFPESQNLTAFWDNLAQGKDCISQVPEDRWSIDRFYDPNPDAPGKTYGKWMGVLKEVDRFDPLFFNISPAEAELMDPQQRLFLENCWRCIEDAGLNAADLSGIRCGVLSAARRVNTASCVMRVSPLPRASSEDRRRSSRPEFLIF